MFKYSNSICAKFVEKTRANVMASDPVKKFHGRPEEFKTKLDAALDNAIGQIMIANQIPHQQALGFLRTIVEGELRGLQLKPKEKKVLELIGNKGQARASDFKEFALRSMQDFSSNYLTKLYNQQLLVRQQEGRAVNYRLRGIAQLSHGSGLLAT